MTFEWSATFKKEPFTIILMLLEIRNNSIESTCKTPFLEPIPTPKTLLILLSFLSPYFHAQWICQLD